MDPQVPAYVVVVRIASVLGMGVSVALGLFILLGGYWVGLPIMAVAIPCFIAMRLMERFAGVGEGADSSPASQR
ncbi:MAG TPA: hypothetical protein VNM43_01785 [Dehalococcoidia bacterium]|nr:hypothetical protein [Dehalococcoidia bacterium]